MGGGARSVLALFGLLAAACDAGSDVPERAAVEAHFERHRPGLERLATWSRESGYVFVSRVGARIEAALPNGFPQTLSGEEAERVSTLLTDAGTVSVNFKGGGALTLDLGKREEPGRRVSWRLERVAAPIGGAPSCSAEAYAAPEGWCAIALDPSWYAVYTWTP